MAEGRIVQRNRPLIAVRLSMTFRWQSIWLSSVVGLAISGGWSGVAAAAEAPIDFDRQIRPILSNNCFACHGPDAKARKANLRLDVKASAFGPAASGETPILPGNAKASEMVRRITSADP